MFQYLSGNSRLDCTHKKSYHIIMDKPDIILKMEEKQINPGDFIITQLENGLENSRYVLPCFSRNQLTSG